MAILYVGIDLAKTVFAVHGVNEFGRAELVRPSVPRARLHELIATLPPCTIGMEACASAHWFARELAALGHTLAPEHICDGKAFTRAGGSNYAQSGAMTQAEPGLHDGLSWSLAHQIDVHLAAGGPHADDLLLVSIGGPDVLAALLEVQQGALTPEAAMRSCDVAVAACATQLERLLAAGAKRVAIANVADFGRTPAFASLPPAAGLATALAQQWNRLLAEQAPLRDARATLVDAFAAFGDMLDHPAAYGFTNVRDQAFDPQRTPPSSTLAQPITASRHSSGSA